MVSPEAPPDYTGQLPEVLDESKWMANRMTFEQMLSHSRSRASEERCRTRLDDPPEVCKQLLIDLREGPALWQGLRKHLTVEDTEFVLRMLQEHSDWKTVKRDPNERLRKEYLRLFDECRHFDPDFQHTEMKQRMAKTAIVPHVSNTANANAF